MTDANAPRSRSGDRKRRIYLFVRDRILSGTPPTIREVQAHFGFRAVQSARDYLEALVREGLLDKEPGKARGCRRTPPTLPSWCPSWGGCRPAPLPPPANTPTATCRYNPPGGATSCSPCACTARVCATPPS